MNTIEPSQRTTGYLYQDHGGGSASHPRYPRESWHRTLSGALAARRRNGYHGNVFRILGDDHSEKLPD